MRFKIKDIKVVVGRSKVNIHIQLTDADTGEDFIMIPKNIHLLFLVNNK